MAGSSVQILLITNILDLTLHDLFILNQHIAGGKGDQLAEFRTQHDRNCGLWIAGITDADKEKLGGCVNFVSMLKNNLLFFSAAFLCSLVENIKM